MLVLSVVGVELLSVNNNHITVKAAVDIHNNLVNTLFHAPITWFESNPSGRTISRFSGDLSQVDRTLALTADDFMQFVS